MTPNKVDDVVDSVALFERRRWSGRFRTWRRWLVGAASAIAVCFLTWVVMISSWLGMQQLGVQGVHRVHSSDVVAAAGVAMGTPLARINLGAVEARIEAIPAVAAATVHRAWPHGLVVTVTERQPVAAVSSQGRWWLMDRTGVLFAPSADPATGQPVVVLTAADPETRRQVATVLAALPPDLAAATARVTAATQDSIALELRDGAEVRWGSAAASVTKATVLRALLPQKASFYDVSVPAQPATKG